MITESEYQQGRECARRMDDMGCELEEIRQEAEKHAAQESFWLGMIDECRQIEDDRLGAA